MSLLLLGGQCFLTSLTKRRLWNWSFLRVNNNRDTYQTHPFSSIFQNKLRLEILAYLRLAEKFGKTTKNDVKT